MFKIRTAVLFGVVLILAIVLATTAFFKITTSASSPLVSTANPVKESTLLVPISPNPGAISSAYISNETLSRMLDQAYEHAWDARGQMLLRILNGRYEHRCCGLPR